MEKHLAAIIVVFLFCLLYTAAIAAQDRAPASSADSAAIKDQVARLGFGKRVKVKLRDGVMTRGRITGIGDDHFVVTDTKGAASKISYADVTRITKQNEKLRIFEKPFAAFAITAAFVGTFVVLTMEYFR